MVLRDFHFSLIVEPNRMIAKSLERALFEMHDKVVSAKNTREALMKLSNQNFGLVILDCFEELMINHDILDVIKNDSAVKATIMTVINQTNDERGFIEKIRIMQSHVNLLECPYEESELTALIGKAIYRKKKPQKKRSPKELLASRKLLIVEENRVIFESCLKEYGCDMDFAVCGAEAVDYIRAKSYDLVILDFMLPDLMGDQVLAIIREKYSKEELPVVIVSAQNDLTNVKKLVTIGMNDYIVKPIDFESFSEKISLYVRTD